MAAHVQAEWQAVEALDALERVRRQQYDAMRARLIRVLTVQDGSSSAPPPAGAHDGRMAPVLLDLEDVADALQVSTSTVKRLIRHKKLRAVKVEGSTRVHPDDLDTYVDSIRADLPQTASH